MEESTERIATLGSEAGSFDAAKRFGVKSAPTPEGFPDLAKSLAELQRDRPRLSGV
ncbi:MAG: hypothetical protein M0019_03420 [Actinomycetota bacterium]|nr:hypothetical protein [Actinomycetota bacterium]